MSEFLVPTWKTERNRNLLIYRRNIPYGISACTERTIFIFDWEEAMWDNYTDIFSSGGGVHPVQDGLPQKLWHFTVLMISSKLPECFNWKNECRTLFTCVLAGCWKLLCWMLSLNKWAAPILRHSATTVTRSRQTSRRGLPKKAIEEQVSPEKSQKIKLTVSYYCFPPLWIIS